MPESAPVPHVHAHAQPPGRAVATSRAAKVVTLLLLLLAAGGTALGLARLWPDYGEVARVAAQTQYAAPGMSFEQGEALSVEPECGDGAASGGPAESDPSLGPGVPRQSSCASVKVRVLSGPDTDQVRTIPVHGALAASGIRPGDRVELVGYATPSEDGSGATADGSTETGYEIVRSYDVSGIFRHLPLAVLAVLFAVVVIAVGRLRGLLALLALGVSAGVLLAFVLPALVAGEPGLPVGVVGASAIMFAILYLVHGPNMRTTAALVGTLFGILIMAGISLVAVRMTRLSGIGDEAAGMLSGLTTTIDFRGLLSCSIIIAGLGVLNDVTITQASSVWELRAAAPSMTRGEIYRGAMRIGRDHIASTVYTVFFAYVGAALGVLILLYLYDRPFLSLLTREDIAIEIVRTLCGSIGLVLAVPITTWVAALLVAPARTPHPEDRLDPHAQEDSGPDIGAPEFAADKRGSTP